MERMRPCCLLPALIPLLALSSPAPADEEIRTETFDRDPGWHGVNNRSARELPPVTIRQDFGYSESSRAAGARATLRLGLLPGRVRNTFADMEPMTHGASRLGRFIEEQW